MKRGFVVLVAVCAATACTLEREIPVESFACEAEGPCRDAGTRDGGFFDGGTRDAGPRDGGPFEGCPGVALLPADGRAAGDINTESNDLAPSCWDEETGDAIFGVEVPGRLERLTVDATNTSRPVVIVALGGMCTEELACLDTFDGDNVLELTDVPAGPLAIGVDGSDSTSGPFDITVRGSIAAGESCDPLDARFTCVLGACLEGSCDLLDCAGDGVDDDDDGTVDEDGCVSRPVTCDTSPGPYQLGVPIGLFGGDDGDPRIVQRRWRIVEGAGRVAELDANTASTSTTTVRIDDYASIVLRYSVVYEGNQVSSCEVPIAFVPEEDLVLQAFWTSTLEDVNLTLLHPDGTSWFDAVYTCSEFEGDCGPAFGPDADNRPEVTTDDNGSERLTLQQLLPSGAVPYGVGVAVDQADTAVRATVRIWCLGAVVFEGDGFIEAGDFWKVADLAYDGTTCTATPLLDASDQPLMVTESAARASR